MSAEQVFKLVSVTLLNKPGACLSFSKEGKGYVQRLRDMRSVQDYKLITALSRKVLLKSETKTITAIACHVKEPDLIKTLFSYIESKSDLSQHHIVVFLNAGGEISKLKYSQLLKEQKRKILNLRKTQDSLNLSVLSYHFEKAKMGRIRGLLTDSIVVAGLRSRLIDPLVISNDADQQKLAPFYIDQARKAFSQNLFLDFMPGAIFWALDNTRFPQFLVAAQLWQARERYIYKNIQTQNVYFHLVGCNYAMRLSSYCAIGGYNYDRNKSEDDELGWRLQKIRPKKNMNKHIFYSKYFFTVMNPRRALAWVVEGRIFGMQWWNFENKNGPDIDLEQLKLNYVRKRKLIQRKNLKYASEGSRVHIRKVQESIKDYFFRVTQVDSIFNSPQRVREIGHDIGLVFSNIRFKEKYLHAMKVEWSKSPIIRNLIRGRIPLGNEK